MGRIYKKFDQKLPLLKVREVWWCDFEVHQSAKQREMDSHSSQAQENCRSVGFQFADYWQKVQFAQIFQITLGDFSEIWSSRYRECYDADQQHFRLLCKSESRTNFANASQPDIG